MKNRPTITDPKGLGFRGMLDEFVDDMTHPRAFLRKVWAGYMRFVSTPWREW